MPYADNEGVRVYYEVEGKGPPLLLLHGLGGSLEMWRDTAYVEALKDDYRLVLMDARGHGASVCEGYAERGLRLSARPRPRRGSP